LGGTLGGAFTGGDLGLPYLGVGIGFGETASGGCCSNGIFGAAFTVIGGSIGHFGAGGFGAAGFGAGTYVGGGGLGPGLALAEGGLPASSGIVGIL